MSDNLIEAQRHAEIVEQLRRISAGVDRMTQLQAETNGRLDGVVRHLIEVWKAAQPKRPRRGSAR